MDIIMKIIITILILRHSKFIFLKKQFYRYLFLLYNHNTVIKIEYPFIMKTIFYNLNFIK